MLWSQRLYSRMFSTGQFFGLNFSVWNSGHESKIASIGILYCTIFVIFLLVDCSWPLHTSSQQVQDYTASEVKCTWGSQQFVHYFLFYSKFKILMRHSTTKLVEMPHKKRLSTRHRHEEKLQQPSCQLRQEKTSSTWLTWLYTRRKIILLEMSRNVQCPEIAIHLILVGIPGVRIMPAEEIGRIRYFFWYASCMYMYAWYVDKEMEQDSRNCPP